MHFGNINHLVIPGLIGVVAISIIPATAARTAESGPYYYEESPFDRTKLAPFVPTPQAIVDKMIELPGIGKNDVVYDLGSGDGRIVIAAAKKGARAVGFEIDGDLVTESRANIETAGVEGLAEIRHQDLRTVNFSEATVVTMYLLPDVNLQLKPTLLRQLRPGARIVSHGFDMGGWRPDRIELVEGRTIYLWTIPTRAHSGTRPLAMPKTRSRFSR